MKPRRFRLDVVGDLEDRPRLLRAYGRIRGAEVAVVLRPTEQRGIFVQLGKESCRAWKSELEAGERRDRGRLSLGAVSQVRVGRDELRIAGDVPAGLADGSMVDVAVTPGGRARILVGGDAPRLGTEELSMADAIAQVKSLQRGLPPKGPATLRGRWTGALIWDEAPTIELKRRLAAYGTLTCRSGPTGWSWVFERSGRWYGDEKQQQGEGVPSLMEAIENGVTAAMLLVKEACGFRDTRRRAAVDEVWAAQHPIPEPKERPNPVERLGAKGGCGCKGKPSPATSEPPKELTVSDDPLTGPRYDRMPRERGESVYSYARRLVTEASARAGEGHHRVARELLDEAGRVAAGLSGSKATRVHEHVDHVRAKLETPPPSVVKPRAAKPQAATPRAAKPARTRTAAPQADAKKDALLLNVFKDAVQQALSEVR